MILHRVPLHIDDVVSSNVSSSTTFTVDELLEVALSEVGYKEKETNSDLDDKEANAGNENYTKYARDLHTAGYYQASKQGHAWCDMFVDWCFLKLVKNKTGKAWTSCKETAEMLICQTGLYGAGCRYSRSYYEDAGRLGNLPVKGAQIFFTYKEGEVNHTGIVTGYTDSTVSTVEGNSSEQVTTREYKRTDSTICGYGYPRLTGLYIPSGSTVPADPPDISVSSSTTSSNQNVSYSFNGLKYSDKNPPLYCPQTQSTCWKGTNKDMTIRGVLWHDTGAGNPELRRYVQPDDDADDRDYWINLLGKNRYNNDWNHAYREAGMNCWIGKLADGSVTTVQTMPWNYKPWGCGGACNDGWIQFEICDDVDHGDDPDYFHAAYEEACQITAYLCAKFNLDPLGTVEFKGKQVPVILDHRTSYKLGLGCNHGDVRKWFQKYNKYDSEDGMKIVRQDVAKLLSAGGEYVPIIKEGDVVTVKFGAVSKKGERAPAYVTNHSWIVSESLPRSEYAKLGSREDAVRELGEYYKKVDLTVVSPSGSVTPPPNTGNLTNEARIWKLLSNKVKDNDGNTNYFGVAGIMGNMYCESSYKPKNLQGSYEKSLTGLTGTAADDKYTIDVDNGTYTNFVHDSAGYGLVQWTYWSLKEELLKYAQEHKKSIGDLDMQVEFLCHQLSTKYKSVWNTCCNATSIKEASNKVLHEFERPKGHDSYNKESQETRRAEAGQKAYTQFYGSCSHSNTVLSDASSATCEFAGYSGDEVCSSCGLIVKFGSIIPAKGHTISNGVCTTCGASQSQIGGGSTGSGIVTNNGLITREDLVKMLAVLKEMLARNS